MRCNCTPHEQDIKLCVSWFGRRRHSLLHRMLTYIKTYYYCCCTSYTPFQIENKHSATLRFVQKASVVHVKEKKQIAKESESGRERESADRGARGENPNDSDAAAVRLFVWGAGGGNGKFLSPPPRRHSCRRAEKQQHGKWYLPRRNPPARSSAGTRSFPDGIWNLNDDGGKKTPPLPTGRRTLPNKPSSYHSSHRPIDREKKYYYIYISRATSARVWV